jgi:hypothetical protein
LRRSWRSHRQQRASDAGIDHDPLKEDLVKKAVEADPKFHNACMALAIIYAVRAKQNARIWRKSWNVRAAKCVSIAAEL